MIPGFVPALSAAAEVTSGLLFAVGREGLLVRVDGADGGVRPVDAFELARLPPLDPACFGTWDGKACLAAPLPVGFEPPAGYALRPLRSLFGLWSDPQVLLAGQAAQIVDFEQTHRFCGRCGSGTEALSAERARRCPSCGLIAYPRISPAVIVLVRRGREALLARSTRFPLPFFSTLAGFVEIGETLEDAVAREIREEVGVEVAGLRYFGSQPWPFPHSLMVAFIAEHAAGEIRADGEEIAEARWFAPEALPQLPLRLSIARRMIDAWVAEVLGAGRSPGSPPRT